MGVPLPGGPPAPKLFPPAPEEVLPKCPPGAVPPNWVPEVFPKWAGLPLEWVPPPPNWWGYWTGDE